MRDESLKTTMITLNDNDIRGLLKDTYDELMEKIGNGLEDTLENLVKHVMHETGLSKPCAIKYINKFFILNWDIVTDCTKRYPECYVQLEWKPAEQVLEEGIELGRECEKLLFDDNIVRE